MREREKDRRDSKHRHSEEWTTSLQRKGQPLNNGQDAHLQLVHYSEVPLYWEVSTEWQSEQSQKLVVLL